MAKCKFCYLLPNGDIPRDRKDLLFEKNGKISINEHITNGCFDVYVNESRKIQANVMIFENNFNKRMVMGMMIWSPEPGKSDREIGYEEIPIKYCPMCGRKLN